jgi:hypothetical protein
MISSTPLATVRVVHLKQPLDHQPLSALDLLHVDSERLRLEAEFRATPSQ